MLRHINININIQYKSILVWYISVYNTLINIILLENIFEYITYYTIINVLQTPKKYLIKIRIILF